MPFRLAPYLAKTVPGMGVIGAIVGAAGSVAKNAQLLKDGKITRQQAAVDVSKETAGAGVATAFSAAVVGVVGGGLAVSLGVAVAAAVAGKFAWDRGADAIEARVKNRGKYAENGEQTVSNELVAELQ